MAFIKSHSNYVLSKKHQNISDGTIWERDITTIGGVNQFSPGQIPIYNSNNFIITVRNDGKIANQYNRTKWKDNESGDTWTLETISGITSEFDEQNDVKIVLKQDYYDFLDFAYYGSLSEMFRASINDILQRFPGELYVTNENVYYTSAITSDFEKVEEKVLLGEESYKLVSNPFGINIHSINKPADGKELKFFADGGYENYNVLTSETDSGTPITNWRVTYYYFEFDKNECKYINYTGSSSSAPTSGYSDTPYPCKGDKAAEITIDNVTIYAYIGDDNEIVYLSEDEGIHIRPNEKNIAKFYNECDNFEKLILNRKTTPKYKATFSVINENEKGFYRMMEDFIFPTSYGGYNVDASSFGFNNYTIRLSEIGNYYDSLFTDSLYRSMTHEAIKNFDWTYTREFYQGDEEEYVYGGEKIQKALRVFAREFDEIITYIDNIKNVGRITYDERSNVPDYFLIDEVKNKGWDTCLVYPYDLEEYYYTVNEETNERTKNYVPSGYSEDEQLDNKYEDNVFERQFSQNTKKEVTPYSKKMISEYPEGYFISCCDGDGELCQYEGTPYKIIDANGIGETYYDECDEYEGKAILKNRVKSYTNERSYTYMDANNEFLRRLAINSPCIWRHKGTVEGLEMILSMFGLKSKKWVDRIEESRNKCNELKYDYEIVEYSSFTNRIEEKWDAVHQMYRIDWINSTKTIVYDYRSTSNYTKYGAQVNYLSYQGLPVAFRDEYLTAEKPYIKASPLTPNDKQESTDNEDYAFKNINENNSPVIRRYLYPNFNKKESLDGNPYFQMDGGWMAKTVQNTDDNSGRYNFQYDVNDKVAYTKYVESGVTNDDGTIEDNEPIYKETIRNIKRVDNISELVSTPIDSVKDGTIFYVSNVEKNIAIIDNEVYYIKYEYYNDSVLKYVSLIKNDDYIKIGDSKFFTSTITVYDRNGDETLYSISDKENGYEIKAYIMDDNDPKFICKSSEDGAYTIDSFAMLGEEETESSMTNYFIIEDSYYCNRLATEDNNYGWRRLKEEDPEYIRINTIINYYEGNNGHNGNMRYDSGHNYFTYFKRLFKHSIDNELFDERCYESYYYDLDNEIYGYGFKNLIDDNEEIKQYFPYISGLTESKIHYFGSYYKKDEDAENFIPISCNTVMFYGENEDKKDKLQEMYQNTVNDEITVNKYILNDNDNVIGGSPYSGQTGDIDEITNQILNNKRLTIKFYLHNEWHTNQGQCELKYLDTIVMNYLSQMIPSTAIVDIQYISQTGRKYQWVDNGDTECFRATLYALEKEQESTDGGETWTDTGKVRRGEVLEEYSLECVDRREETKCNGTTKVTEMVDYYKDTGEKGNVEIISEEPNSEECGYAERWVDDSYECIGHDKHITERKQISSDGGSTWQNTNETRTEKIEYDSEDCACTDYTVTPNSPTGTCDSITINFTATK